MDPIAPAPAGAAPPPPAARPLTRAEARDAWYAADAARRAEEDRRQAAVQAAVDAEARRDPRDHRDEILRSFGLDVPDREAPAPGAPAPLPAALAGRPLVTAEARLLAAGWAPPSAALRAAIVTREAFRQAMATFRGTPGQDPARIVAALDTADPAAIGEAVRAEALGEWCDRELGQPGTFAYELSRSVESALYELVTTEAPRVLASLEAIDSPDAAWLRGYAGQAAEASARLSAIGPGGRLMPASARAFPPGLLSILIPR